MSMGNFLILIMYFYKKKLNRYKEKHMISAKGLTNPESIEFPWKKLT
jgi:hypothetical protein